MTTTSEPDYISDLVRSNLALLDRYSQITQRLHTYAATLAATDKLVNPREVAAVIEKILEGRG